MKLFKTTRKESFRTRLFKIVWNLFPSYRRGGGRVIFISHDWREVQVRLSLNWLTKNYVGTIYGGSIYSSIDPVYMLQLMRILGGEFVVWDKAANIRFKKPAKTTLYTQLVITDETLTVIKSTVAAKGEVSIDLPVELIDKEKVVYAEIIKTLYIATKQFYKEKLHRRKL